MIFTKKPPPGPALNVWLAFEKQFSRPPQSLEHLHPNRNQRARGVPRYVLDGRLYADSVKDARDGNWETD